MHKEFRGGGSKGSWGVGSKVQFWGPISLCLCAFLGLELLHNATGNSFLFFLCGDPSKPLAAPQLLLVAFPLGDGGLLRCQAGEGLTKEGDGWERIEKGNKDAQRVLSHWFVSGFC